MNSSQRRKHSRKFKYVARMFYEDLNIDFGSRMVQAGEWAKAEFKNNVCVQWKYASSDDEWSSNLTGYSHYRVFKFCKERDYILFLLRWS
jgi:hypothetical protein